MDDTIDTLNIMQDDANGTSTNTPHFYGSIPPRIEFVEVVIVTIFLVIAIIGNILIVFVKLFRYPFQQSPITNHSGITMSISFADVLSVVLALCDIVKAVAYFVIEYPLPVHKALCSNMQKIILVAFSMSNFVTLLLTSGRYRAVCSPLTVVTKYRDRWNKITLCIILAIHTLVFVNDDIFVYQSAARGSSMPNCFAVYRSLRTNLLVSVEMFVLVLSVTLSTVLMSFFLYRIFKKFAKDKGSEISAEPQRRKERNIRAVKILISMYIAYITSFVPWVVLYLIGVLDQLVYMKIMLHPTRVIFVVFIAGSFCNSFLTYMRYSESFRKDLSLLVRCKARSSGSRHTINSSVH